MAWQANYGKAAVNVSRVLLEVCCGSADDVIEAHKAVADRAELNCDLFHGGLTPTLGEHVVAKRETGMKIIAIVRPREGGFCYTQAEFATALYSYKLRFAFTTDAGCLEHLNGREWTDLCLAPCGAFLLFALARKNNAALVAAGGFTICHSISSVVNFIL